VTITAKIRSPLVDDFQELRAMVKRSKPEKKPIATPDKPIKWGGLTHHGFLPVTDPRYQSGWNFLSGKFLNPRSEKPSNEPAKEDQKPEPPEKAES
jgi:hypothetical protein